MVGKDVSSPSVAAAKAGTLEDPLELFDDKPIGHWSNLYVGIFVLAALCWGVAWIVRFVMW